MDKKKILLIGEFYRPLINWFLHDEPPKGVPGVYNLYKYLSESNEYQFHSIIYNPSLNLVKEFPNGSIIELKKFSFPIYYIWKLIVFFKLILYTNSLAKKEKFDLIYGLSTFSLVSAIVGKWRQLPSVGRIYGTILTKDVQNQNYLKLYTRFLFDVLAIKFPADKVICTLDGTDYDKVFRFFNPNTSNQPILLYNGMDKKYKEQLLNYKATTAFNTPARFCYIARLEYYKRQEIAIETIEILVHKYNWKDLELTIVGSGSKGKILERLVKTKGLERYIKFIPEMPHREMFSFINQQDAGFFLYEGGSLGNILWETAMAGKLIITVNNGGTGNLFKDNINSIIVPESDEIAKNIASKLILLKNNSLEHITTNSRELVNHLVGTWEERFNKEFKEIIFATSKSNSF